ncbi:uncharacterized protein LOC113384902 isoform X1 [Ctenocephalides felis]|uniref:uncharacterized protein LOC113384902 isoform X1 n=2 Tax=Ctenocephalides felis TaxID=7515 RepID=UPI000E6E1A33|nr:uncharacterized protein LOC113384902 isoform X1 [Ctenocephalides felis]
MQLFCKCLNVAIEVDDDGIQNIGKADLGLSPEDISEPIFQEKLGIIKPLSIAKQQPCLLQSENSQGWILHKCLNCNMHTHAIQKDSNRTIVVNLGLLSDTAEINSLRKSEKFSPIFKVVINHSNVSDEIHVPTIKSTVSQSSDPLQTALSNLQQQLTRTMQQEMQATEQRIRNYQEEQYLQLEEFREKAHNDYNALAGTIMLPTNQSTMAIVNMSSQQIGKDKPKIELTAAISPPLATNSSSTNSSIGISPVRSSEMLSSDLDIQSRTSGETRSPHSSSRPFKSTKSNVDCEGLFDLEGMDDEHDQEDAAGNDSDSSNESDGGLHMNSARQASKSDPNEGVIARSLPISVPTYISMHKGGLMDSDSDSMTTDSGMDIAASIKAIAKSVHGDAVFGELPRPRFRTQI